MSILSCRPLSSVLFAAACLVFAPSAQAAILSAAITGGSVLGSGAVVQLNAGDAPFAVGEDNFNTDNLYIFDEQQNVTLSQDILINIGGSEIALAAGTVVSSQAIVFDPDLIDKTVQAKLTFDGTVLGYARRGYQLTASDFLGLAGVTYNHPSGFALEASDLVANPTATSIAIDWEAGTPGDIVRIITLGSVTTAVPEPSAWALMLAGLGLTGAAMRRARGRAVRFA